MATGAMAALTREMQTRGLHAGAAPVALPASAELRLRITPGANPPPMPIAITDFIGDPAGAQIAQEVDEVISEAVIIIDQQKHGTTPCWRQI